MLDHPWLKMKDNYEYKHSDKEYEVHALKKQMKEQLKPKARDDSETQQPPQDMGELEDSSEQVNEAEAEEMEMPITHHHSFAL